MGIDYQRNINPKIDRKYFSEWTQYSICFLSCSMIRVNKCAIPLIKNYSKALSHITNNFPTAYYVRNDSVVMEFSWWQLAAGEGFTAARTRANAAKIRKISDELRPRLRQTR